MSYDLEQLHARGAVQIASVRFATATDLGGTTAIPGVAGQVAVVHQIFLQASAYFPVQLSRATGAASAYWIGFGNQTAVLEPTRFVTDAGASVFIDGTTGVGSGIIRIYWTSQKGTTTAGPAVGNL